jgi:hypothetical protein
MNLLKIIENWKRKKNIQKSKIGRGDAPLFLAILLLAVVGVRPKSNFRLRIRKL